MTQESYSSSSLTLRLSHELGLLDPHGTPVDELQTTPIRCYTHLKSDNKGDLSLLLLLYTLATAYGQISMQYLLANENVSLSRIEFSNKIFRFYLGSSIISKPS